MTSHRRRRWVVPVAAAVAVVTVGAFVARARSRPDDPVDKALSLLAKEARFDSSREAVASFAAVYQDLVDATRAFPKNCNVGRGRGRCLALNQAAGWTLVFSPASGHCTQPAIQVGRLALRDYVKRSAALSDAAANAPPLPPIPTC